MRVPRVRFPVLAVVAMGVAAGFAFVMPAGAAVSVQSQSPPTRAVSLPFKKGIAFGQAMFQVCGPVGCRTLIDQHNIQIVKK